MPPIASFCELVWYYRNIIKRWASAVYATDLTRPPWLGPNHGMTDASRRTLLTLAGAGLVAGTAAPINAKLTANVKANAAAKTFVLVHGTWLGGWIWADVAERLRRDGHKVYTPTLTGVGERHHLISPDIGLETHITDLTAMIDHEELSDIILIAHSFSGVATTGAADRRKDRIRHIAFFDALIPHAGRMSAVEKNPDGSETDYFAKRRAKFIDGYQMDYWAEYPAKMMISDEYPELQAKLRRRLTPHPVKTWTDNLVLENGGWDGLPRTCFRCKAQAFAPSSEKMWGPARGPGWQIVELATGRMGMMTNPDMVSEAFAKLG
jgi:pimeloyl-ACP methyl ester carboxylesterase